MLESFEMTRGFGIGTHCKHGQRGEKLSPLKMINVYVGPIRYALSEEAIQVLDYSMRLSLLFSAADNTFQGRMIPFHTGGTVRPTLTSLRLHVKLIDYS